MTAGWIDPLAKLIPIQAAEEMRRIREQEAQRALKASPTPAFGTTATTPTPNLPSFDFKPTTSAAWFTPKQPVPIPQAGLDPSLILAAGRTEAALLRAGTIQNPSAGWATEQPPSPSSVPRFDPLTSAWLTPTPPLAPSSTWTLPMRRPTEPGERPPAGGAGGNPFGRGTTGPGGDVGVIIPDASDALEVLLKSLKGNPSPQKAAELRLKVAEYRQYTLTHGTPEQRAYMRTWWAKQDQLIQAQVAQNSR